jgi:hypothetical protein
MISDACLKEVRATYVPHLYGGGRAIQETLYKDCIERHGYRKVRTEQVPYPDAWWNAVEEFRPPDPTLLEPICGAANVTCL